MAKYHQPKPSTTPLDLSSIYYEFIYSSVAVNVNDPDIEGPHIHDCYELYINVTGDVSFLVDNCLYPIRQGDIVLSKPNAIHHCIYHKSCVMDHFVLWISVPTNCPFFNFTNRKNFSPLLSFNDVTRKTLLNVLYQLHSAMELNKEEAQIMQTTLLLQFLTIVATGENLLDISNPPTVLPEAFQTILNALNQNFLDFHSIDELAEQFFVSPATINRWFRKYLHLSPKEFLEAKKLSLAKSLLEQGASATEAGAQAGFFDTSHFIAVFKKKFGKTPLQYKRSLLQQINLE